MDDRVEPDQVIALDIADVHSSGGNGRRVGTEGAGGEQVGVQANDLVAGPLDSGHQHGSDVAVVTCDENAQWGLLAAPGWRAPWG
jgi:hypothetical protein